MKPHRSSFDPAYVRWRAKFAPVESRCFEALCEFVRVNLHDLLDRFLQEGHESIDEHFPEWAFEHYLREIERMAAKEDMR